MELLFPRYTFIDPWSLRFRDDEMERRWRRYHNEQRFPWVRWKLLSTFVFFFAFCIFQIITDPWNRPAMMLSLPLFGLLCALAFLQPPSEDDPPIIHRLKAFWQTNWRNVLIADAVVLFISIIFMVNRYDGNSHAQDVCYCPIEPDHCALEDLQSCDFAGSKLFVAEPETLYLSFCNQYNVAGSKLIRGE